MQFTGRGAVFTMKFMRKAAGPPAGFDASYGSDRLQREGSSDYKVLDTLDSEVLNIAFRSGAIRCAMSIGGPVGAGAARGNLRPVLQVAGKGLQLPGGSTGTP
jgi:hypothetical protein